MSTEIRCDGCGVPLDTPRTLYFSRMPLEDYHRQNSQAKDSNNVPLGMHKLDLCDACERSLFEPLRKLVK